MKLRLVLMIFLFITGFATAKAESIVKMSKNGICHAPGTTYYNKTKHFTAFSSLEACLKAGGRLPNR